MQEQNENQEHNEVNPLPASSEPQTPRQPKDKKYHHKIWHWFAKNKKWTLPACVLLVVGVLAAVPFTRYALAGLLVKKDFSLTVLDSQTGKPITSAKVALDGQNTTTNNAGLAKLHVAVGKKKLKISKKYYRDVSRDVLVGFKKSAHPLEVKVVATGRQVPVLVLNLISQKPVANALVKADGSEVKTDKIGKAVIVLPADKTTLDATVTVDAYNSLTTKIVVTPDVVPANTFQLVPRGKLYFLSNASGKIDLIETNLDGSERKIVLAGTGKEDGNSTTLWTSADQKFIALRARRDSEEAKIYLIEASSGKLSTIDEGNAQFNVVGWIDHNLVYTVYRNGYLDSQPKATAIKSFNADSRKLITLDESDASSNGPSTFFKESINSAFLLNKEIVYSKDISASSADLAANKNAVLYRVRPDGTNKATVKSFTYPAGPPFFNFVNLSISLQAYRGDAIRFATTNSLPNGDAIDAALYQLKNETVTTVSGKKNDSIYDAQTIYYVSAAGKNSAWSELRDGRQVIFVGDISGENGNQVASLIGFSLVTWYGDNYLLLNKDSTLYVMPASGLTGTNQPTKISNFFSQNRNF